MRVRRGHRRDLAAIGSVAREVFWGDYRRLLPEGTVQRWLDASYSPGAVAQRLLRGGVLVAESDGDVAGFADLRTEAGALRVEVLATRPGMRRRGVARILLEAAGREFPQHADVLLGSLGAEAFFEEVGFVPGEVLVGSWFDQTVVERRWWRGPGDTVASLLAP